MRFILCDTSSISAAATAYTGWSKTMSHYQIIALKSASKIIDFFVNLSRERNTITNWC